MYSYDLRFHEIKNRMFVFICVRKSFEINLVVPGEIIIEEERAAKRAF
jgi:hypothetical protein